MTAKPRILVVDDDVNLRRTLADILRVKGYESVVAGSGAEALAAVEQAPVALALIDLMLPDMSGLDVMERLKASSPHTETIILTGHASLDTAIEATRRGAFCYMLKPYQMDDLLLNIRHGVDQQQAKVEIRRLSEALRQSHEAIAVADAELRFEYVNPAFSRLLGYSIDDLAGQSVAMIGVSDGGTPDPFQSAGIAAAQGGFRGETLRRSKDDRLVPVLLSVAPIRDERGQVSNYVGTMTDLSGIKRMEESLRESEAKFRSISASAQDAIIMIDEDGLIRFWNAAAETIFGYPSDVVLGKDMHALCAPERFHAAYRAGFEKFRSGGLGGAIGRTLELAAIRSSGEEFPIEISLSAVQQKGHWLAIGIVRDISERKRAERAAQTYLEQLTRSNSELQELYTKLEQTQGQLLQSEKMASIGLLAAGVAHEINNPVGFIKSNMQSLSQYVEDMLRVVDAYRTAVALLPADDTVAAGLHRLEQEIGFDFERQDIQALLAETRQGLERVTKIVQDLKDFSHIETREKWDMEDIHKGIESTLNVIWNELKYTCEVKKEYGRIPPVECLLSQLNQVFMNLLVNAAHSIEGKGTITIRTGSEDDMVWIEISDTGKGIAQEDLSRIFDPFFTTKPVGKGTGLGLSVSYSIIHKHHGRITVASQVGKGTTFRIWLPIRQPPSAEVEQAADTDSARA